MPPSEDMLAPCPRVISRREGDAIRLWYDNIWMRRAVLTYAEPTATSSSSCFRELAK